jgi:hypothetical protein
MATLKIRERPISTARSKARPHGRRAAGAPSPHPHAACAHAPTRPCLTIERHARALQCRTARRSRGASRNEGNLRVAESQGGRSSSRGYRGSSLGRQQTGSISGSSGASEEKKREEPKKKRTETPLNRVSGGGSRLELRCMSILRRPGEGQKSSGLWCGSHPDVWTERLRRLAGVGVLGILAARAWATG